MLHSALILNILNISLSTTLILPSNAHLRMCHVAGGGESGHARRAVLDFTPSPHRLHSLGSAGRRSRRQWGSACAMRLARSAASCNQGWPGPPKIAQRRRDGWLRSGRRDPGRRRRLGQCVKTRITRRCAVRACFSTALKQGWARARTQTTQGGDMAGLHSSGSQAVNVS